MLTPDREHCWTATLEEAGYLNISGKFTRRYTVFNMMFLISKQLVTTFGSIYCKLFGWTANSHVVTLLILCKAPLIREGAIMRMLGKKFDI